MWSTVVYLALLILLVILQRHFIITGLTGFPNLVVICALTAVVILSNDMFSLTAKFSSKFSSQAYKAPELQKFLHVSVLLGSLCGLMMLINGGITSRADVAKQNSEMLFTLQPDRNDKATTDCPKSLPYVSKFGVEKGLTCYKRKVDRDTNLTYDNKFCILDRKTLMENINKSLTKKQIEFMFPKDKDCKKGARAK